MATHREQCDQSRRLDMIYARLRNRGLTYREVGEIMGVGPERARQRCNRHSHRTRRLREAYERVGAPVPEAS
jgi:hypothetical protein